MPLGNALGWYGFLILIPFIILYIRRPKLHTHVIPSLMFLTHEHHVKKRNKFLQEFIRSILFLMQLLALCALAFALTAPFLVLPQKVNVDHTVVVIDVSASSQTSQNGISRFDQSVQAALNNADGTISIIAAAAVPEILLEQGSKRDANKILSATQPFETTTNIAHSMYLAADILDNNEGHVIVVSDFQISNDEDTPLVAKRALNARDISVEFIQVGEPVDNIGIIDLSISKQSVKATVKNYNEKEETINLKLVKDGEVKEQKKLSIIPQSVEVVSFTTLPGLSEVIISENDPFMVDNKVFISSPVKDKLSILLLTNKEKSFLRYALDSIPNVELEIREPPIVKAFELHHDVIVIGEVTESIVPADVQDIKRYVAAGTPIIVTAHENLMRLALDDLLPVSLISQKDKTDVNIKVINRYTKDTEIPHTSKHYEATIQQQAITIAVGDDDTPILAESVIGNGTLFYYGIFDKNSDFKATEDYPIFWSNLINYLLDTEEIAAYNFKLEERPILKRSGLYPEGDKDIAVNLLNEQESDVTKETEIIAEDKQVFSESLSSQDTDVNLEVYLLILVAIILVAELVYVKLRGDA
jgi:hypothetical protein